MSLSLYVNHPKKLFFNKTLTIGEVLGLMPRLQEFGIDKEDKNFDMRSFLDQRMQENYYLLLGIDGESARGFEFSLQKLEDGKSYYSVRIFTPSSEADWKHALSFTKTLANKLGVNVLTENGDVLTPDELSLFDYRQDILYGLNSLFGEHTSSKEGVEAESFIIFGIHNPVSFNPEIKEKLLSDPDPVEAFSKFVTDIQNLDAYRAKQFFYQDKNDGSIFGSYTLSEDCVTILPFKPSVEFDNLNIVKPEDVKYWKMNLVSFTADEKGSETPKILALLEYNDFIMHLPKEKYQFIDADNILVERFTKEEMIAVLDTMGEAHQAEA